MITKGIRGAITVDENSIPAIKSAVVELLTELIRANDIKEENISHVIFTMTKDLDAVYPAQFARTEIGWNNTALMCEQELYVKNSLEKCVRVLIVLNCDENFEPKFVYLKGATNLRRA